MRLSSVSSSQRIGLDPQKYLLWIKMLRSWDLRIWEQMLVTFSGYWRRLDDGCRLSSCR